MTSPATTAPAANDRHTTAQTSDPATNPIQEGHPDDR
jgi:hypothetical protein